MVFDFKKEFKILYLPKNKPEIIDVPSMNFIAVRGKGNPNAENGAYAKAPGQLYAIAYTLKMSYKSDYAIKGFFEYVVPPPEGFWWLEGYAGMDYGRKDELSWISAIRLPDFVLPQDFDWAVGQVALKKQLDCSNVEFMTLAEGLCVQMMHMGHFDEEPASVALMHAYMEEQGYTQDFSETRRHHEIYLSDIRKVEASKWKTVIRHPVRKK